MPSMTDQVSYLRAQLAHRDAQLEQVRAERDNHVVQEEEKRKRRRRKNMKKKRKIRRKIIIKRRRKKKKEKKKKKIRRRKIRRKKKKKKEEEEEEILAHLRLLSSEAKDWKSRVVTETEEMLCRESVQIAQQATEAQEAMDQHYKTRWQQAEADLKVLCKSTVPRCSLLPLSCVRPMRSTNSYILHKRDSYNSRHKPYK